MNVNGKMTGMLALALLSVSCSRHLNDSEGNVFFSVDADSTVEVVTRSNVSDYTTLPDAGDFTIVIANGNGDEVYNGRLDGYNTSTALKSGNYSVKATYGNVSDEGFGKPCLSGEKTFSVTGGSTVSVAIPVSLANSIVKVECTDRFKSYYTDYSFTVKTGAGTEISFPKGEARAAFVDAYTISVSGTLTNQGGKTQNFSKDYKALATKTCYTIKFDVSNVGGNSITVSFDDTVEDVGLVDIDLND